MKQQPTKLQTIRKYLPGLAALLIASTLNAQNPIGQWDFNGGNLTATVGSDLTYADPTTEQGTSFGATDTLGIPAINGTNAQVMKFPDMATSGMGYQMPVPAVSNGGGSLLNEWTLLMDVLYPAGSNLKLRPLLDSDVFNANPEFTVTAANALGIGGGASFGTINTNTWYRLGIVVTADKTEFYINGVRVGGAGSGGVDGRFAISGGQNSLLLAAWEAVGAGGYVNSVQLRDVALTTGQMLALGGPSADGLPQVLPPVPSYIENWIPSASAASRTTPIGVVINRGDTTISTGTISFKLNGTTVSDAQVSTQGSLITVLKSNLAPFAVNTTNNLEVTFTDSLAGQKTLTHQFRAVLLYEDFEELPLLTSVEENAGTPDAWTPIPPVGWVTNQSGMPGYGDPATDGRTEWAGWTFAKKEFWIAADNQTRDQFLRGSGTLAIADPDEWDDADHPEMDDNGNALYYNSFLSTAPINIAGMPANSVFIKFDSSWRPEGFDDWGGTNNQTGTVTVSYDGGPAIEVLHWDSNESGPYFHPDSQNEAVFLSLTNPASATNMVITFGLTQGANDWWWAFDNLEVSAGLLGPAISGQPQPQLVGTGGTATFTVQASGTEPLTYVWLLNGTPVPSASNASTLTITNVQAGNAGTYSVIVSNSVGSATSEGALLTLAPPASVTGQWDFNDGNLAATVGTALAAFNDTVTADTQFGTTTSFGIADIAGAPAKVMYYSPSASPWPGYIMTHGAAPNGGGTYVNQYSLIFDLLYPTSSDSKWRALLQTNTQNSNDGDLFINAGNGIGISGNYQGPVPPDVWNRIVVVFDLTTSTLRRYLNGTPLPSLSLGEGLDGRWSLDPTALLFADEDGETNPGYVNSIQFRNGTMSDAEIAALGGVITDGIPMPVSRPSISSITKTGDSVTISWQGAPGLRLQQATALTNPTWSDVPGTTGSSSVTLPTTNSASFFRLAQ